MTDRLICECEAAHDRPGGFWARLVREDDHGGTPQTDWLPFADRDALEQWAGENFAPLVCNPLAGEETDR